MVGWLSFLAFILRTSIHFQIYPHFHKVWWEFRNENVSMQKCVRVFFERVVGISSPYLSFVQSSGPAVKVLSSLRWLSAVLGSEFASDTQFIFCMWRLFTGPVTWPWHSFSSWRLVKQPSPLLTHTSISFFSYLFPHFLPLCHFWLFIRCYLRVISIVVMGICAIQGWRHLPLIFLVYTSVVWCCSPCG